MSDENNLNKKQQLSLFSYDFMKDNNNNYNSKNSVQN
jgi:hypothetical protein